MTTTEAGGVVASYLLLRKVIGWIGTLLPTHGGRAGRCGAVRTGAVGPAQRPLTPR
jgi:hypothetical protein